MVNCLHLSILIFLTKVNWTGQGKKGQDKYVQDKCVRTCMRYMVTTLFSQALKSFVSFSSSCIILSSSILRYVFIAFMLNDLVLGP